ncbi:hypothetical protein T484DRAFT_1883944, partial [Baffinella frigidus]
MNLDMVGQEWLFQAEPSDRRKVPQSQPRVSPSAPIAASGRLCVSQAAPIAALFVTGAAVGVAGPGAPFLTAQSVFSPSQLAFPVGSVDTPFQGFDALLTAAEEIDPR